MAVISNMLASSWYDESGAWKDDMLARHAMAHGVVMPEHIWRHVALAAPAGMAGGI